MTRTRSILAMLAVAVAAVLFVAAMTARGWQEEHGVWNPLRVQQIRAYDESALGPVLQAMSGRSPAAEPGEDRRETKLRTLRGEVAQLERGAVEWQRHSVTGRFAAHYAALGQELRLGLAYYRTQEQAYASSPASSAAPCVSAGGYEHMERARAAYYGAVLDTARRYSEAAGTPLGGTPPLMPTPRSIICGG